MIKKLQRKFISITAAALFAMILVVLVAINGVFIYSSNQTLNNRLEMMLSGNNFSSYDFNTPPSLPDGADPSMQEPSEGFDVNGQGMQLTIDNNEENNRGGSKFFNIGRSLRFHDDGIIITLDADGNVTSIEQNLTRSYDETELTELAASLFNSSRTKGWHNYFKYRIQRDDTCTRIALMNGSDTLYSIFTMFFTSLGIGLVSYAIVLLIIVLASRRAVKPIAESYDRQKQFVTDASHELKTPLTVISGNNEMSRILFGESEWFDGIDKQVTKMNELVKSLITLAKMDEGQAPVFTDFSISDAVFDTAKSFESLLHSKGKLITFDIEEDLVYHGDESKIRQLVSILMDNAAKYCSEQGKVAVKLFKDKQIHIQVINDFDAIDGFDESKVFERFYRQDKARKSNGSFGLGLSIASAIVEQHRGEISAKKIEHERVLFEVIL